MVSQFVDASALGARFSEELITGPVHAWFVGRPYRFRGGTVYRACGRRSASFFSGRVEPRAQPVPLAGRFSLCVVRTSPHLRNAHAPPHILFSPDLQRAPTEFADG